MSHTGCVQLETLCIACGSQKRSEEGCQSSYCCKCRKEIVMIAYRTPPRDPNEILSHEWPKTGETR